MEQIINPGWPTELPTEGRIGYVKIENADEIYQLTNPQWIDVDDGAFEVVS